MSSALAYLHTRRPRVFHRDVKSENVLLAAGLPKLCDFGLAIEEASSSGWSAKLDLFVTPPEVRKRKHTQFPPLLPYSQVVRNPRHCSQFSDVYALGLLFLELVCQEKPFREQRRATLADGGLEKFREDLSTKRLALKIPDTEPRLKALIETCTSRNPEQRPSALACSKSLLDLEDTEKV